MAYKLTLGQYLDAARRSAGLSIRQLSEATEIKKTPLNSLLLDQVAEPKARYLSRLAAVLEVNAGDLFQRAGLPAPAQDLTVEALLRTEYDLPPAAIKEAKAQIAAIVARYDQQPASETKGGAR